MAQGEIGHLSSCLKFENLRMNEASTEDNISSLIHTGLPIEFTMKTINGMKPAVISLKQDSKRYWFHKNALFNHQWSASNQGRADWADPFKDVVYISNEFIDYITNPDSLYKRRFQFDQTVIESNSVSSKLINLQLDEFGLPFISLKDLPISLQNDLLAQKGRQLGRFGPNHAADTIFIRYNKSTSSSKFQILLITRRDGSKAFPGGMVDKINDSYERDIDSAFRELVEECYGFTNDGIEKQDAITRISSLLQYNIRLDDRHEKYKQTISNENFKTILNQIVYTGIVSNDPRNTCNAFMVTTAFLFLVSNDLQEFIDETFIIKAEFENSELPGWYDLDMFGIGNDKENLYASHGMILNDYVLPVLERL